MALIMFVSILTLIPAGVLAYGIAVSKVSSKKIIKAVLISVGVCALISIIVRGYGIMIGLCLCMAFIIAYSIFVGTTLLSVYAYKGIPLSMGPVLEATSYIYITIFGVCIFKEKLNPKKIVALLLIVDGILVYSLLG